MNYVVAYILVFELGNITPGKKVLLHSAGGGVVSIPNLFNKEIFDQEYNGFYWFPKHKTKRVN